MVCIGPTKSTKISTHMVCHSCSCILNVFNVVNIYFVEKHTSMTEDKLEKKYRKKKQKIKKLTKDSEPIPAPDELKKVMKLKNYLILIEVVNNIEFKTAICRMNDEPIYRCTVRDNLTSSDSDYYYGKWKDVPVVVVQTGTKVGTQFQYGSWFETKKALYFMPQIQYIFGVGVCGAVVDDKLGAAVDANVEAVVDSNSKTPHLGHVVVSSYIIGYDHQKKKPEGDENRSFAKYQTEHDFYKYLSRSQNQDNWENKLHFGKVLSGSWLVADINAQKLILDCCGKDGIAFEMEGVGIAAACDSIKAGKTKVDCLVVKGISDYANREKNDQWQPLAARNATCFLSYMINKKVLCCIT